MRHKICNVPCGGFKAGYTWIALHSSELPDDADIHGELLYAMHRAELPALGVCSAWEAENLRTTITMCASHCIISFAWKRSACSAMLDKVK